MRKLLLLLCAAVLIPLSLSAATNKAISKAWRSESELQNSKTESRLVVPASILDANNTNPVTSHTLGAWYKITKLPTTLSNTGITKGVLMGYGGTDNCNENGLWNLNITSDGRLKKCGWGFAKSYEEYDLCGTPLNKWVYIVTVVDIENLKFRFYINGEFANECKIDRHSNWFTDGMPGIYFASWNYAGALDEVHIYNRALTDNEVLRSQYSPTSVSGLVGLYTLNVPVNTNEFENKAESVKTESAKWQTASFKYNWEDGLAEMTSQSVVAPTMVDGREVAEKYVTVSVDPNLQNGTLVMKDGKKVINSPSSVLIGTEITLEATPATGYKLFDFIATTKYGPDVIPPTPYVVKEDVVFGANFTNKIYPFTVINDANLDFTITRDGFTVDDISLLLGDATYQLSIDVPEEYSLEGVTLNGNTLTAVNGKYTFTVDKTSTLVISALERNKCTVTFDQVPNGTIKVTADGKAITSGSIVLKGTVINISTSANEGYRLSSLKVNGSTICNREDYTVNSSVNIQATFEEQMVYCPPTPAAARGNSTSKKSGLTRATISDGNSNVTIEKTGEYANYAFGFASSASPRPVYDADAIVPRIITRGGATVTVNIVGSSGWMYTFLYFDADGNGLQTGDKVYSNYDGSTHYSSGTYTFTIPTDIQPGVHRMRYLLNYNDNQGPCRYGQSTDDGEVIFDVDFVIPSPTVTPDPTPIEPAVEYCLPSPLPIRGKATSTNSDRYVAMAVVTDGTSSVTINQSGDYANSAFGTASASAPRPVYDDLATIPCIETAAGRTVTVNISGDGMWLNTFLYFDADGNGFQSSDVVYSNYTGDMNRVPGTYTFTIPNDIKPGIHRMRYILGWSELGPCEYGEVGKSGDIGEVSFDIDFVIPAQVQWTVRGNGSVAAGYSTNVNSGAPTDTFTSGSLISTEDFNKAGGLTFFLYPGKTASGAYESVETATMTVGDGNTTDITASVTNATGTLADGEPYNYYTISQYPTGDVLMAFVFTQGGGASAIEDVFGDEDTELPVEYFTVNGMGVDGNALTPGVYIVKRGTKTAKVVVM